MKKENNKKISLLNHLDDILSNNHVNVDVDTYKFCTASEIIINNVNINVLNKIVKITLYLDEFIIEIYQDDVKHGSYNIPYIFIDNFYIFLEE